MSTAIRTLRPFSGLDAFAAIFNQASLTVDDDELESGSRIQLDPATFLRCSAALTFPSVEHASFKDRVARAAETAGVPPHAVGLLVVAKSRRLRLAEIVHQIPFAALDRVDSKLLIADPANRPDSFRTPFSGALIESYLTLFEHLERAPLRPWRLGTWLARADFRLDTSLGSIGFTPLPLSSAVRDRLGLPPDTLRFAEIDPDDIFAPGSVEPVRLWVDEELLNLTLFPRTSGSLSLQRQLFVDAMTALTLTATRHEEIATLEAVDLGDTLVGGLLDWIADLGPSASEEQHIDARQTWLGVLRDNPVMIIALIENRISKFRGDLVETIKGTAK